LFPNGCAVLQLNDLFPKWMCQDERENARDSLTFGAIHPLSDARRLFGLFHSADAANASDGV
jgi:hypothetical protein